MTRPAQRIPTGVAGLSAFFVVLFLGGVIGVLVSSAHRGPYAGVLVVGLVGAIACGLVLRRALGPGGLTRR